MNAPLPSGSAGDAPRPPAPVALRDRLLDRWPQGVPPLRRVAAGLVGLVAVGALVAFLLRAPAPPIDTQLPMAPGVPDPADGRAGGPAGTGPSSPTTATGEPDGAAVHDAPNGELTVHAAGAVLRPGVHRLPAGSRVVDLVEVAGGLAPDADADRLNLAAELADGARVWVPRQGEEDPPEPVNGTGNGGPVSGPVAGEEGADLQASPVDLNTATAAELDTLPGVGPATAAAIIEYRTANGRFSSVDELLDVRGIGEAKLADLRPRVRV